MTICLAHLVVNKTVSRSLAWTTRIIIIATDKAPLIRFLFMAQYKPVLNDLFIDYND